MKERAIMRAKKIVLFWVYAIYPAIFLEITKNPSLTAGEQRQSQAIHDAHDQDINWQCTYEEQKASFFRMAKNGTATPHTYYNFFQIARSREMYNEAFLVAAAACIDEKISLSLYESWKEMIGSLSNRGFGFINSWTTRALDEVYKENRLIKEYTKILIRREMREIAKIQQYDKARAIFVKMVTTGKADSDIFCDFLLEIERAEKYDDAFMVAFTACLQEKTSLAFYQIWKRLVLNARVLDGNNITYILKCLYGEPYDRDFVINKQEIGCLLKEDLNRYGHSEHNHPCQQALRDFMSNHNHHEDTYDPIKEYESPSKDSYYGSSSSGLSSSGLSSSGSSSSFTDLHHPANSYQYTGLYHPVNPCQPIDPYHPVPSCDFKEPRHSADPYHNADKDSEEHSNPEFDDAISQFKGMMIAGNAGQSEYYKILQKCLEMKRYKQAHAVVYLAILTGKSDTRLFEEWINRGNIIYFSTISAIASRLNKYYLQRDSNPDFKTFLSVNDLLPLTEHDENWRQDLITDAPLVRNEIWKLLACKGDIFHRFNVLDKQAPANEPEANEPETWAYDAYITGIYPH